MIKSLFICHGNIMSFPMAEFVMKKSSIDAGLTARFQVASRPPAQRKSGTRHRNPVYLGEGRLARYGISCEKQTRRVTRADYAEYDYRDWYGWCEYPQHAAVYSGEIRRGNGRKLLSLCEIRNRIFRIHGTRESLGRPTMTLFWKAVPRSLNIYNKT